MMIARLEEAVWDLTDEGVLLGGGGEKAACPIIVLHSASCAGGCEPASDCTNNQRDFRFYGAGNHWTRQPPLPLLLSLTGFDKF